jgi:hypothetical protein
VRSTCAHQAEERCFLADKKGGFGEVAMEEAGGSRIDEPRGRIAGARRSE